MYNYAFDDKYTQGGVDMKKRLSMILAAIGMLASGMASMGCVWFYWDEPDCKEIFID